MPIIALHVAGYRSVRDVRLELGRVNVLVGPNGCGKSNLYRALYLLAAAAEGRLARTLADEGGMPSVLWAGERGKGPVRMSIGVELDALAYEMSCGLVPPAPLRGGLHVLPQGPAGPALGVLFHLYDDLLPGAEVGDPAQGAHPMDLAGPAALLWPTFLSILGWGCEGFALFLLLRGFHQEVPLGVAVFFYATATLAGALVPVPGGLGVAEAMIQEQLVRLGGVAQGAATASMILIRFATLWWAVLVGFAALFVLRLRFGPVLSEVHAGAPEEA